MDGHTCLRKVRGQIVSPLDGQRWLKSSIAPAIPDCLNSVGYMACNQLLSCETGQRLRCVCCQMCSRLGCLASIEDSSCGSPSHVVFFLQWQRSLSQRAWVRNHFPLPGDSYGVAFGVVYYTPELANRQQPKNAT